MVHILSLTFVCINAILLKLGRIIINICTYIPTNSIIFMLLEDVHETIRIMKLPSGDSRTRIQRALGTTQKLYTYILYM